MEITAEAQNQKKEQDRSGHPCASHSCLMAVQHPSLENSLISKCSDLGGNKMPLVPSSGLENQQY